MVGSSTEERNDEERNNGIPEAGRKQIFEKCPKRKEELDQIGQILCIFIPKSNMGMYLCINGINK